MLLNPIKPR